MRFLKNIQPLSFLFVTLLVIAVISTGYTAINNIVAEQSRIQQQAISPVFSLVNQELLTPLNIATTLGQAKSFNNLMDSDDIDQEAMFAHLTQLEKNFDLIFFVASEKARKQYFSDGRVIDLIEGKVFWYFEALAQNKDLIADLGQVGDVHLYFDVKIYNEAKENLGFVGVGKPLATFLNKFETYKAEYGYDFLFVNDVNEIILTSFPDLVVVDAHIPTLDSLEWYTGRTKTLDTLDNLLINVDGEDYLISEISINELDWKLLLLVPLHARQAKITKTFITNITVAIGMVVVIFALGLYGMMLYKRRLEKNVEIDPLSGLPNRSYVHRRYNQLKREHTVLCVIMVDLDHFKDINDNYGHNAGDFILSKAAGLLTEELRQQDVVGRWGGEEFVMLIPGSDKDVGEIIATRACERFRQTRFEFEGKHIPVTASFGLAYGHSSDHLSELLAKADRALYEAKRNGRDRVEVSRPGTSE